MRRATKFSLFVAGMDLGSWSKVGGLDVNWEVAEYSQVNKLMLASPRGGTLTLKRPRSSDLSISSWHLSRARMSCSLVTYDADGKPVSQWRLKNARPMKVVNKIDSFTLEQGVVPAIAEEVTLAYEHMYREY